MTWSCWRTARSSLYARGRSITAPLFEPATPAARGWSRTRPAVKTLSALAARSSALCGWSLNAWRGILMSHPVPLAWPLDWYLYQYDRGAYTLYSFLFCTPHSFLEGLFCFDREIPSNQSWWEFRIKCLSRSMSMQLQWNSLSGITCRIPLLEKEQCSLKRPLRRVIPLCYYKLIDVWWFLIVLLICVLCIFVSYYLSMLIIFCTALATFIFYIMPMKLIWLKIDRIHTVWERERERGGRHASEIMWGLINHSCSWLDILETGDYNIIE